MSSLFRDRSDSNGSSSTNGHHSHDIDSDPYKPKHLYAQLGGHQNHQLYPPSPSTHSPALSSSASFSHHTITSRIDRYFHITERGSTITTEVRSGVVSFATMCYILIVNSIILSAAHTASAPDDHMPFESIVTATALTAALGSAFCGIVGNLPFGLAAGMGLNSYFTYGVVIKLNLSWRIALAAAFIHGIIFLVLSLVGLCNLLQLYAPPSIKKSITVGLGLFQALIGFEQMRLVVQGKDVLLTLGDVEDVRVWLSVSGLLLIAVLLVWRVKGAMLLGMIVITLIGWFSGLEPPPSQLVEVPTLNFYAPDFVGYWQHIGQTAPVTLMFLFVSIFDTAGVQLMAAGQADLLDEHGHLPHTESTAAFVAAALSTCVGAVCGTSPIIIHTECCAGIADGARTGLHSVVVAVLFIVFIPFVPVLRAVPALVTAPCLIIVGMYMMAVSKYIDWERIDEALPAFLTSTLIAFTYSIANGVLAGLAAFAILKSAALAAGQFKQPDTSVPLSPDVPSSHPPPLSLGSPARGRSSSTTALHSQPHAVTRTPTGLTSEDDPLPGSPVAYYVTPQHLQAKRGREGSSRRLLSEPRDYGSTQEARF